MHDLTPQEIVAELDKYIVGQQDAKRAVAIAIRNRWRRQQLPDPLRNEVGPKNIIMIGPTGVGKTEIARRLAALVNAPFVKVEATRYTEVGYHGRDVEGMVRDLLDLAINMVRSEQTEVVRSEADRRTEERLLDALIPHTGPAGDPDEDAAERRRRNREKFRQQLRDGLLDDREIEMSVDERPKPNAIFATVGIDQFDPGIQQMLDQFMPKQARDRRLPIREARKIIFQQECDQLIDRDKATEIAIARTENSGIIFIDEIDKICGPQSSHGPDVSRQGVQRDLLPIVEGTTVMTRNGPVRTEHILFIAAGAFHASKPNDLMPELQGRFPIRVELSDLTKEDFVRILTEPKNAITRQHVAMLATEGVRLEFTPDAVEAMAELAWRVNRTSQNTGARRLYTISEKLLEEISFTASERHGESIVISGALVHENLHAIMVDEDLSKFIL
ncbi:MAG: ATP-dependent protease ATPase subunit HslU [Phycisphaerae bacterium]|nr:ATP-dependent protease ATPase subunit HslU [Phycisphaerae bacterium]